METNDSQPGEAHLSKPGLALSDTSRGAHSNSSARKFLDNPFPQGVDLSPVIRPRPPTHNTPYSGSRRLVGPPRLESLFERKYLVNKQAILGSDVGSSAPRRPFSDELTSVDKANAHLSASSSVFEPRFRRRDSRNTYQSMHLRKVTYASLPPSPSQAPPPLSTTIRCLSQVNLRRSNKYDLLSTKAKRLNKNLSNAARTDTAKQEKNDHLPAKKSDDQPAYACMERAIDLFLDHNQLLEDIRRVQPFGMYGAVTEESDGTVQRDRTGGEPEATSQKEKLPTLKSVEPRKDAAEQWSPSDWANATTPQSSTLARLKEVDAYTIGALNSVSVTRVSGTEGGHHVVLSALEWGRFKRTVSNLISANLVLQAKLRLTQRHFRSLGYSGDLEQTLAKLKSEELRIRRELALRESQFADSFTLSARLQEHKAALTTAEQRVNHLKDEARNIKNVKEMLKQAKDSIQSQKLQWQRSHLHAPYAGTTTFPCSRPTTQLQCGAQESPQLTSSDTPLNGVQTSYVEIHRCIRIAANKCFIVHLFAPVDAVEQRSAGQHADGKSTAEISARGDRQENSFVLSSTTSNLEVLADYERAHPDSRSLDLRRVGQVFLGRQMDETITCHSKEILLVVFNAETGDTNIQPLRLANSEGSTIDPRQANLKAVADVICRNLRLCKLPFKADTRHTNFRRRPCADVMHHTLEYARSPAIERLIRRRKEKHRVVLADEVDETSIYDAEEELLYTGCHELKGCSAKGPRHYLVRIYRCCPRYLVARVFSPRSVVFHTCWIDAYWAIQIYESSDNLVSSAPPVTTVSNKTTILPGRPRSRRDGGSTPQHRAASPLCGAARPREYLSGASDAEKTGGDRKMVARTQREDTDVKGDTSSSATAFNPSFIRFVARSLRFDKDRLCFTATEACATDERMPLLSVKKGEHFPRVAPSGREKQDLQFSSKEQEEGYEHEIELDSSIAACVPGEADINAKAQCRLCDIRERQRILPQSLLKPTAATSTCMQALKITHAQIVQRSKISEPESFKPCFMLIQSCIMLAARAVTFVVYEPASSWRAESSFSLIDALTLIHKRRRTFIQRLGVDKSLLEELFSAVKSNSFAAPHRLSCTHICQNGSEEKETNICGGGWTSHTGLPCQERDIFLRVEISGSSDKGNPLRESELVHAAENMLNDVAQPRFAGDVSESAKSEDVPEGLVSTKEGCDAHEDTAQAEQQSQSGVQLLDEEERVSGTDESTAPCGPKSSAEESGLQKMAPGEYVPAVSDVTKASMLEKQNAANGIAKSSSGPTFRYMNDNLDPGCVKSLPGSNETMTAEVSDARERSSAGGVHPREEVIQCEKKQKHEPDAFTGRCMPLASPPAGADDSNPEQSGSANTSNVNVAQNRARALETSSNLPTSDGSQPQSEGIGVVREHLSEKQWKSLVQEIFAELKVSGNDIVIPGLSTVPVAGLWKIMAH